MLEAVPVTKEEVVDCVLPLLLCLERLDYAGAIGCCMSSRLGSVELARAVGASGKTVCRPPVSIVDVVDMVRIEGGGDRWSVVVPLWTEEEGRSDLSLEGVVERVGGRLVLHLDDVHVL
jgi:hypothetical protein